MPAGTALGWGYEGKSVEDLVAYCARVDAYTVVDVRLNAISRKKGFSKAVLAGALKQEGIKYVHLRSLGNPKDNRPGFAHPGSAEGRRAHRRFESEVLDTDAAREQIEAAEELLDQGNVVFLCYEDAPDCCHRHLIIERLHHRAQKRAEAASMAESVVG